MIIALYLPDNFAEQFKYDRLQDCLHRLRILAEKTRRSKALVAGEEITSNDVALMRQFEASFCVAREVDKKEEILIDPNDPTRGGKVHPRKGEAK